MRPAPWAAKKRPRVHKVTKFIYIVPPLFVPRVPVPVFWARKEGEEEQHGKTMEQRKDEKKQQKEENTWTREEEEEGKGEV